MAAKKKWEWLDWKPLISEDGRSLSIGRVAFWISFGYSTYFWFHPIKPYPMALLEIMMSCLAYILGKAGVRTYNNNLTYKYGINGSASTPQTIQPVMQQQRPITTPSNVSSHAAQSKQTQWDEI